MRLIVRSLVILFFFIFFSICFPQVALATTTPFRSARTVTTDGFLPYTNLDNCSITDGETCDRATELHSGHLYFRDFGSYDDFGIPIGSKITDVRMRVTGKASVPIFALLVTITSASNVRDNCQWFPWDIWTLWQLNGNVINTQTFIAKVTEQWEITSIRADCLEPTDFENKSFMWNIRYSNNVIWSANIDNFEIAFDYEVSPTPTPTPGPVPFLDLPWDYEGKGLTFNEAALSINSYFDHEYPLLSSGVGESIDIRNTLTTYRGEFRTNFEYSSHDGYDYGIKAKANNGDAVLAAGAGVATYVNSCSTCGNMIVIDHGNRYQTRYMHLQKDGLVTSIPGDKLNVSARQKIGQVGATGYVLGENPAHIHFGVFEDKNKDGDFEDNVPDGVTDPFGWQSTEPDPWENYSFKIGDENKTGNKSYYLWTKQIDNLDATLTSNGGIFNTERYELNFPHDSVFENIKLIIQSSPIVKALDDLRSIGSTLVVNAFDALGNAVTNFTKPFTITIDFSSIDLSSYNTDTIFIYSSTDGVNWIKAQTAVDLSTGIATAQFDHLSHFALMAERSDTTAATSTAVLDGGEGQENWFRSDVKVSLNAKDDNLGVDYTLYKIEGGDWQTYKDVLIFTAEGHYKIEFYSVDKDENIEDVKSVEFDIDKTSPEAKIFIDQDQRDLVVNGIDQNQTTVEKLDNTETKEKYDATYIIKDLAGNALMLDVRDRDKDKKDSFRIYSTQYNEEIPIIQPNNSYHVSYRGKKDKRNVGEQKFRIEKEIKIKIKYSIKKNQSKIFTKEAGEEKAKEIRDGLVLLQLTTENGTIKYSY